MYGAMLGDIIGSPYEFDKGDKSKDFPLFSEESEFTDDTVMTVAVCEGILNAVSLGGDGDTLTDIAAAMAEAMYGIPAPLMDELMKRTDDSIHDVMARFEEAISHSR